jgi:hypothetical protein
MRLKLTHKDERTSLVNMDTGEELQVISVRFERASVEDLATITITMLECHVDLEVDAEVEAAKVERAESTPDPRKTTGYETGNPAWQYKPKT